MKILMPIKDIPIGEMVTKKTGEKEYMVRDKIRIFGDPVSQKELCADDNTRFLINENGDINVVSGDKEYLWLVSEDRLLWYLQKKNEPHQI